MKKINFIQLFLLLPGISFLMITCEHEIPSPAGGGNNPPIPSGTCNTDTVYFVNEILPVINSNCATIGCHDAITKADGKEFTSYSRIMEEVKPFRATDSDLYEVITKTNSNRMPQPPFPPLTAIQIDKIKKWINQGALNNQCTSDCDPAVFTYSGAVSGTINKYCKGCHNPLSLNAGIDLSTYTTVKANALNGYIPGVITHSTGFKPMPQGGSKLSDCQITQIQKWIAAGAPNN